MTAILAVTALAILLYLGYRIAWADTRRTINRILDGDR